MHHLLLGLLHIAAYDACTAGVWESVNQDGVLSNTIIHNTL
jgi:hypothetical protein